MAKIIHTMVPRNIKGAASTSDATIAIDESRLKTHIGANRGAVSKFAIGETRGSCENRETE